jgi:branched-chain amino acid transport system substrate-binding protein
MTRKSLAIVALFGALMLTAAACSNNKTTAGGGGGGGGTDQCQTDRFGCVTYRPGEPIRIGTLLAISGDVATLGLDSFHGAQLGVDYLDGKFDEKPGQLLGHEVNLQSEDDLCSKDGGQAGGTKLAADPTILSVIGTSCSSSALGVADKILGDKGILLISPSNTAAGLTSLTGHNAFYLRTAQNDAIQARVVADFVSKQGIGKAATIHDESPYATGLTDGFKSFFEKRGGQVVAAEAITSTDTDFKPLLTSIAQSAPELIYLPDFNPACALIAKQAKDIPALANVKLMGSDGCNASTFFDQAGKAGDGFLLSSPIASPGASSGGISKQYNDAYRAQYGNPTASFNANAFDAFNILVQAIKKVAIKGSDGSVTVPRRALRDAIFQTKDYQGVTGPLTCIDTGDCQSQLAVNIGVYESPNAPTNPDTPDAKAIFSETFTLQDALAG